jgi:hypothetical protein
MPLASIPAQDGGCKHHGWLLACHHNGELHIELTQQALFCGLKQ